MSGSTALVSNATFNFCSRWQLAVPRRQVWDALVDVLSWQQWWPGLEDMTLTRLGGTDGVGSKSDTRWRGPIGYQLSFSLEAVELIEHELLRVSAEGDLSGHGCWRLGDADGRTDIQLEWTVDANHRWMEFLAPVARPVFVHGHDCVMQQGAAGLASYLGVEPRDFHTTS